MSQYDITQKQIEDDINNIVGVLEKLSDKKDEYTKQLSSIDKELNNLYHIIEYVPMSASKMSKTIVMIRDNLRARRKIKEVLHLLNDALLAGNTVQKLDKVVAKHRLKEHDRYTTYVLQSVKSYNEIFKEDRMQGA